MKSDEFLGYIRGNGISVRFIDGKMTASPREKVEPLAGEFKKFRSLLEIRARGIYKGWQGATYQVRDECGKRGKCFYCLGWYPIYLKNGEHSGLCQSRKATAEFTLKGLMA